MHWSFESESAHNLTLPKFILLTFISIGARMRVPRESKKTIGLALAERVSGIALSRRRFFHV